MKVYVEKRSHNNRTEYLAAWSCDGWMYHDWFPSLKELKEYISAWNAEIVKINF